MENIDNYRIYEINNIDNSNFICRICERRYDIIND